MLQQNVKKVSTIVPSIILHMHRVAKLLEQMFNFSEKRWGWFCACPNAISSVSCRIPRFVDVFAAKPVQFLLRSSLNSLFSFCVHHMIGLDSVGEKSSFRLFISVCELDKSIEMHPPWVRTDTVNPMNCIRFIITKKCHQNLIWANRASMCMCANGQRTDENAYLSLNDDVMVSHTHTHTRERVCRYHLGKSEQ